MVRSPDTAAPVPPWSGLVAAAAAGDAGATRTLVEQVGRSVFWAVRSVLGPGHADLDDIVQQSLIAFVQSLPRFRNECEPKTYAVRIAVRAALAGRRSAMRRERAEALIEEQAASVDTPADQMAAARRRKLVRNLLDELPAEQAEALALHVVLGVPLKEISEAAGAPLNTVKSRLRLAKRALRDKIAESDFLAEELGVGR